jgi:hypothetical protein
VESIEVKVSEDKIHGSLSTIIAKPANNVSENRIADAVNEILGRYTVKCKLEVSNVLGCDYHANMWQCSTVVQRNRL